MHIFRVMQLLWYLKLRKYTLYVANTWRACGVPMAVIVTSKKGVLNINMILKVESGCKRNFLNTNFKLQQSIDTIKVTIICSWHIDRVNVFVADYTRIGTFGVYGYDLFARILFKRSQSQPFTAVDCILLFLRMKYKPK